MNRSTPLSPEPTVLAVIALISVALLSGCASLFASGQIETRQGEGNSKIYSTWIGDSKTTTIDAILGNNGQFGLFMAYTDNYALIPDKITIDTDSGRTVLRISGKTQEKIAGNMIRETGRVDVNRTLLEQITYSNTPVIYIQGEQGTVIIKLGTQGKRICRPYSIIKYSG